MKVRRTVSIATALCLVAAMALAAEPDQQRKAGPTISAWLQCIQQKMASLLPKKSLSLSTGVAGVRGAKEDAQSRLYWKGKKDNESVSEEELTEFRSAIDLVSRGERAAAIKELEEFMTEFPDSALIPDAKKTLDLVKAEPEATAQENMQTPAPEQKPAAPSEPKAGTSASPEPVAAAPSPAPASP